VPCRWHTHRERERERERAGVSASDRFFPSPRLWRGRPACTSLRHQRRTGARLLLRDVNLDGAACRVIQEGRPRHIGILALEAVIGTRSLRQDYYKGFLSPHPGALALLLHLLSVYLDTDLTRAEKTAQLRTCLLNVRTSMVHWTRAKCTREDC